MANKATILSVIPTDHEIIANISIKIYAVAYFYISM